MSLALPSTGNSIKASAWPSTRSLFHLTPEPVHTHLSQVGSSSANSNPLELQQIDENIGPICLSKLMRQPSEVECTLRVINCLHRKSISDTKPLTGPSTDRTNTSIIRQAENHWNEEAAAFQWSEAALPLSFSPRALSGPWEEREASVVFKAFPAR